MKKILFALTICLSAVFNASAQNDALEYQLIGSESDTLAAAAPNEYLKVDTIDYLSDQVQNLFFSAHVGLSLSMSENTRFTNFFAVTRPSFRFSVGKFFYPQFGLRGSIEYLNQRGRIEWESAEFCEEWAKSYPNSDHATLGDKGNYDFSMLGGFLDGMIDFHNVLWKYKENRRFHLIGYFGLGFFYTFGFDKDKLDYLRAPVYKDGTPMDKNTFGYDVDGKSHGYFAGRAGLIASYQITDAWDVSVDASFNGTDDAYNGIRFRRVYDTYVNLMAGITYHIKDNSGKRRLQYSHYTDDNIVTVLNRQIYELNDSLEDALKPVIKMEEKVAYNEMLQTTVSFYIDKTFITDAQKRNVRSVARFMENHPDLDVVVTGYADVQTAYPKYNMMLSRKRATAVYNMLVDDYGIDPARLTMDYKGDQEQPFNIVNEWNRAVVFFLKPHVEASGEAAAEESAAEEPAQE